MMANEKSSEGAAATGLPANPAAKPAVAQHDPQTYDLFLSELREPLGLPEKDFQTVESIVTWMKGKCEEANGLERPGLGFQQGSNLLRPIIEAIYMPHPPPMIDLEDLAPLAERRVAEMHIRLAERQLHEDRWKVIEGGVDPSPSRSNLLRDALERILQAAEVVNNGDLQSRIDTLCDRLSGVGQPRVTPEPILQTMRNMEAVGKRANQEKKEPGPMADFLQELLVTSDLDGPAAFEIFRICMELAVFLISKNKQYGDSALDPVRIMSSADPIEQIKVRMDDKLSRLFRGEAAGEDTVRDFVGYWILLEVAERRAT